MEIPFVGGTYTGRSTNINAQICQNLYPVLDQEGGKVKAMMNTPGLTLWTTPGSWQVRGLHVMGDYVYAVVHTNVYRLDKNADSTTITGTLKTSTGRVWMANNGTQIMIVDGAYGYTITGTTLTQISDADFPVPIFLTYQDGYFIIAKSASNSFYISASYDGTSWSATDYASAESYPDNLLACISSHRELWLLGKQSYEVWYNSGDATFPFERISGATNRIGIIASDSLCEFQGTIAWLDDNRKVRASEGYNAVAISTPQVEYQIAKYSVVSDAIGFMYSQEGHTFYVLTFPTESKTWGYDFTTRMWHKRASGVSDIRHRANCYALFEGMHIVGDYDNGKLYKYDLAKYTDDGTVIRRVRAAQPLNSGRKNIFHHSLEVEFESGVGLANNDSSVASGTDPQAVLDWSDDGGHTWSNQHWADIGPIGKYKTRAIWRRLGRSRDRVYRVAVSDPVKCVLIGANLEAEKGTA